MQSISVVVVDDHTLFRTGLNELLTRRGLRVVGMTGDASEALGLVTKTTPDVVLLDLRMGEVSGLTVLEQIITALPEQCVVVLTTSIEELDLVQALRQGASGYLLKDMEPDDVVDLLHKAKSGETVVAPDLTSLLARAVVTQESTVEPAATSVYHLTPREKDILCHIAKGRSNKEIAKSLGITDGTVKLHVRSVMKKLEVSSRVQAAVLAVSEGLCEN